MRSEEEQEGEYYLLEVATDGFDYSSLGVDNTPSVSFKILLVKDVVAKNMCRSPRAEHIDRQSLLRDNAFRPCFRSTVRTAIVSSPTTSPAKAENFAENFSGGGSHPKFDSETISKWRDSFTTEDDSDVEFRGAAVVSKVACMLYTSSLSGACTF